MKTRECIKKVFEVVFKNLQEDEVVWHSQVLDKPQFDFAEAMDQLALGAQ